MNIESLHQKFVEYGVSAKEWQRKCLLLLPEIEKHQVWKKKGFSCIYEYAAKLAGISRYQTNDALRVLRKIADKPELMAVAQDKGVGAVRPIATIATAETARYFAKKVQELTKNELEVFVSGLKKQGGKEFLEGSARTTDERIGARRVPTENESAPGAAPERLMKKVEMLLRQETLDKLTKLNNNDWDELMGKLIAAYEAQLAAEKPQKVVTSSRHIPRIIAEYVEKRANGKCEFPGCKKPFVHLHHVDRFASQKEHDPDRIVALCKAHHDLAHRGLVGEEGRLREAGKVLWRPDYTNLNWFVDEKVQFYRRR